MDNGDAAIFINIYWISVEQYRGEVLQVNYRAKWIAHVVWERTARISAILIRSTAIFYAFHKNDTTHKKSSIKIEILASESHNLLARSNMETQVLIPQEFSLVLTAPGGKKSREQVATVFTTARIPQGTVLYPFQGTVRTDKLEIYSYLDEHDVSEIWNLIWLVCGMNL